MRKYFPLLIFAAVALICLAMAAFALVTAQDAARIKFEATADDALNRIESRVNLNVSLLVTTQAFFAAHPGDVTTPEFRAFFNRLDVGKNFDGLRGLGFLGLSARNDAALNATMARFHDGAAVYPASDAELRTPVLMFEPLDADNRKIIGYDMFSEPKRREAIQAAIDTGQARASAKILLGEAAQKNPYPGFLIFSSLDVEAASVVATPDARTPGLLYAAFRTGDLFKAALDKFPVLPVHADVFDGRPEPANLMFSSETPPKEGIAEDFVATRQLLVAGRPWTVEFRPTSGFVQPSSRLTPIMLGLCGLLFAGAIALMSRYQARAYDAMARLQEASEKSLLEKDLMLQEMKHRIKNSIARVLAMARQTAANSRDIAEFSHSFAARLQAMAASQDMLTRSRWQKADLGELLTIELKQVFGRDLPDGMLSGPPVELSETMTQALGLTFHELATNALKYGEAASNSPDVLRVDWAVATEPKSRHLRLTWTETGQKEVVRPVKTGFGTKLIDMNITRELGGTIIRDYRPNGLVINIDIPLESGT